MTELQLGDWIVERSIVDGATGAVIAVNGGATLRRDVEPRLRYDEVVSLCVDGKPLRATRTYFYRLTGTTIVATFADDRPFFTASLKLDDTATAMHPCGNDVYFGTLVLRAGDVWHTRWRIVGSKSLSITTRYSRRVD